MSVDLKKFDLRADYNCPKPYEPVEFQRLLTELAGEYTPGVPHLRVAWAPEVQRIRCGKMRPVYYSGLYVVDGTVTFKAKSIETGAVLEVAEKDYRVVEEFNRKHPDKAEWLLWEEKREEWRWLSVQRWVIEQFYPPEQIQDSPINWEMNRYMDWYDPEKGMVVRGCDMIGPFPFDGRYQFCFDVALEEMRGGKLRKVYRDLDREVFQEVSAMYRRREQFHQSVSDERAVVNMYDEIKARDEREEQQMAALFTDVVREELTHKIMEIPFTGYDGRDLAEQNRRTAQGVAARSITIGKGGEKQETIHVRDKRRVA